MACTVRKGRDFTALVQFTDNAYGVAPTTPNPLKLKFNQVSLDTKPVRQTDPTIQTSVLMEKTDEVDQTPDGSGTSIADLNGTAYFLLSALFGPPVTTGSGPYVHTFTMTNACKPDFLMELSGTAPGSGSLQVDRYLGAMVKSLTWDLLNVEQNFSYELLMARLVSPMPGAVYDATPNVYAKARAVAAKSSVSDTTTPSTSTLGLISGATVSFDIGLDARRLADGVTGYGIVLPGQIMVKGTVERLYEPGGVDAIARANGGTPLYLKGASNGTETIAINIPNAEFSLPPNAVADAQSIVRSYEWMAYNVDGANPITVVLTNSIAGITT